MRTFEIILIGVNVLSLFLSFKRHSKATQARIAFVNVLVFMVHAILEGLRYQMIFSYMGVGLLVVFALSQRTFKGIAISLSLVFLAVTSFLAYAFPVFTLPRPTGDYAVGIQYFHLIDENRTDPFLDGSTKKRELMVKVYYPAKQDDSKSLVPYFHGSSELITLFAEFYNMPGFLFDHLSLVNTNAKEGLQVSDRQQTYPVVLFSHGAGTTMEVQTSQSEDLASHGYIVVAIDHTYVSAATAFPDRVVFHKEATTSFNVPEPAEIITQIMADDSKFVMETLDEMNDGTMDSIFQGKLNLDQIGAIGHSVGGAVAYNLAINDSRVKAAIDLDGTIFIAPEGVKEVSPFLMLANDKFHIQAVQSQNPLMKTFAEMDDIDRRITLDIYGSQEAYEEAYKKAQQNIIGLTDVLRSSGNLFTIEGSDHMKFTDIGLFIAIPQLREQIGIGGETDPARCLEITKAVTLAFFDHHLKGKTNNSLASLVTKYPELKNVDLK